MICNIGVTIHSKADAISIIELSVSFHLTLKHIVIFKLKHIESISSAFGS